MTPAALALIETAVREERDRVPDGATLAGVGWTTGELPEGAWVGTVSRLDGKVALVTGASMGIGRGIARGWVVGKSG
jgi:hypothetical protein